MDICVFAHLHVDAQNKWKIWKIKNVCIGDSMANNFSVNGDVTKKPFTIDIFNDSLFILFSHPTRTTHFVNQIKFPKKMRKPIIKLLKEYKKKHPEKITLRIFGYGNVKLVQ